MPSIRDLFPDRWLKPHHLAGRSPTVAIEAVTVEPCFNPRSKRNEARLVVQFHAKQLRLILNKTQAVALASLTGDEDYSTWPGHLCQLSAGVAPNGAPTIVITPAPDKPRPVVAEDPDPVLAELHHVKQQARDYLAAEGNAGEEKIPY